MLEVCVWAWYKRSQTLWHLRREEVWQCWSNSSGEIGHSPPPHRRHRQHCVCVCLCVTLCLYIHMGAFLHTSSVPIWSTVFARALSEVGLFNFTASPVCRGVFGRSVCVPALAPCVLERVCDSWQPRASVPPPPLLLLLLILLTCSGSRGSRKSRFRCLICQTIGEKLKGGRLQWHDWDDECSFDRS